MSRVIASDLLRLRMIQQTALMQYWSEQFTALKVTIRLKLTIKNKTRYFNRIYSNRSNRNKKRTNRFLVEFYPSSR